LKAAPSGAVFYCHLLVVRYLTQRIVGLFNTRLRFLPTANPPGSRNRVQNVQRGKKVNKTELIEEIAKSADLTKASAARALDAMIDAVTNTLKNNDSVTLVGFGTFTVGDRAARTGRDPRTKEAIKIKAAKVPKFKAGKALKDAVN
jgi:DNA-binding protein HU-beta